MSIMETQDRPARSFRPGAVVGGLVLLALGAGLLLERSGALQVHHVVAPFVLIVLGAVITFERGAFVYSVPVRDDDGEVRFRTRQRRGRGGGLWLIVMGVWLLIAQNHLWGFTFETSWPLFIIFMGVTMVIRGWR
jgi:hypothetical protein